MKIKDTKNWQETIQAAMKIKLNFTVSDAFSDLSVKDKKAVTGLFVNLEASHSGIVNGNQFFYMPKGMANGAETFVKPFNKPVHVNHDTKTDPIGRVIKSEYVDYGHEADYIKDSNYPVDVIEFISDFVKSPTFKDSSYKGLGHLALEAEITDSAAIQKILDKRYLTVSIGGTCKDVTCSRCGVDINQDMQDFMSGKIEKKDGDCFHEMGTKYSDSEHSLFWVAGDMEFDEISYVSSPADPNAISTVANSKAPVNSDMRICDMKYEKKDHTIYSYFKTKDNQQESTKEMKIKLKDFLSKPEDTLAAVKKVLTDMKLDKLISTDEKYSSLRATSYLFADQKVLPIHDKAHVIAAKAILETLEDDDGSETLKSALEVLNAKAKRLFGDNVDDAQAKFVDENKSQDTVVVDNIDENTSVVIDYQKLADIISSKLTDLISSENKTSYEFLLNRNAILEKELEDAVSKEKSVTDQIKSYIIDHILTLDKNETAEQLQERTVESLNDKLKDLKKLSADKTVTQIEPKKEESENKITDTNLNPGADVDKTEVKDDKNTNPAKVEFMDTKEVAAEYKKIMKSEGLFKAGKYLEELRKTNKVHKDFRLY